MCFVPLAFFRRYRSVCTASSVAFLTSCNAQCTPPVYFAKFFHASPVYAKVKKEMKVDEDGVTRLGSREVRTEIIPVETSIKYMQSKAFKITYGDEPVWKQYRRNFKGAKAPKTRKLCIRVGVVCGNPCPICRDEYLVVDYRNVELLKHFISKESGEIITYMKTGVCQKQHQNLIVAYLRAKDYGLITFDVPFRKYDYVNYRQYLDWKTWDKNLKPDLTDDEDEILMKSQKSV